MLTIKDKTIASGNDIYVIAEMACAHDGDVGKAKAIIDAAVDAKADAIQLQFFSVKDLMTPRHEKYDLLTQIEFSPKQWDEIFSYARQFEIHIFVCTYCLSSAELAINLEADGIKLNSSDLSNPQLLEVVAKSKIPFTLGTGASTIEEIACAVETAVLFGNDKIIIMHGLQNFPTDIQDAHIHKIKMLRALFPFPVGYQDHTDASHTFSRAIDLLAIGAGASVIEKHVTLNRFEKGTDYQAALEPTELMDFVVMIRNAEHALGSQIIEPLAEKDKKYRKFQKKSIVALKSFQAGAIITNDKIASLRTGEDSGIAPSDMNFIIGKKLVRDVHAFQPLAWRDVEDK